MLKSLLILTLSILLASEDSWLTDAQSPAPASGAGVAASIDHRGI